MVIWSVKEEMSWSFNLLAATANEIYAILKIMCLSIKTAILLTKNFVLLE